MWSLVLVLAVCSPHRITGEEILRSDRHMSEIKETGNAKSLVSVGTLFGLTDVTTVDLSGLELNAIENNALDELDYVKTLNLNNNKLEEFPSSIFSKMTNLENLSVANNNFEKLGESFGELSNLKKLDLSNNRVGSISEQELRNLPKSTELIMEGNPLRQFVGNRTSEDCSLQERFGYGVQGRVTRYDYMISDYEYNKNANRRELLASRPSSLKLCMNADHLVESVSIATNDRALPHCTTVKADSSDPFKLNLNSLGIKKFARGWYQISNPFFTIDLSHNDITEITPELLNDLPSHVTAVYLSYNEIPTIKKNVIENRFLKVLQLKSIGVSEIEDGAFEKTELDALDLIHSYQLESINFIKTLPSSLRQFNIECWKGITVDEDLLSNLKALRLLYLEQCMNGNLPVNLFRGLKELEEIYLQSNDLKTIELGTFDDNEKLTLIDLSNNRFQSLPSGLFNKLGQLETLYITRNHFRTISQGTFSYFKNKPMGKIFLRGNNINRIEEGSFSNMDIDLIDLGENQLGPNSIADGAFTSSKIFLLNLDGNSITSVNSKSFSGLTVMYLNLRSNGMTIVNKGAFENMCTVTLDDNQIERIENGAFRRIWKASIDSKVKSIKAGIFQDV